MVGLPIRARVLVLGSMVRAAAPWCLPFVAIVTTPWQVFAIPSVGGWFDWRLLATAAVLPPMAAMATMWLFPHGRFGRWAVGRIRHTAAVTAGRTVNLTEQLAIATGAHLRYEVLTIDDPVPNVAALPGPQGAVVVVTSGAEHRLDRDALEALIATQIVVVSDRWVRRASAAQLVGSLRFVLLFLPPFINPMFIPLAFLAFLGHRRSDAVRDVVADATALAATRHPDALARALFELRPAAGLAQHLRIGLPGFLVDQFWVLSSRMKVTTTVSGPVGSRRWTTTDEIAAEMAMRSDRMRRAATGDDRALWDLRSWRRAVRTLGTGSTTPTGLPLPLTPDEVATGEDIAAQIGSMGP